MQGAGDYTHIVSSGDNARVVVGDYYERHASFAPDDPEWDEPPEHSGLVLCPCCRRMHLVYAAVAGSQKR